MHNTNAINIFTDGAMDYDGKQSGGTGYAIVFPELSGIPDLEDFFRRDRQGIHRLEMIAILEALEALLKWSKQDENNSLRGTRVILHTDRFSLTDTELLNPWRIAEWRKNKWKNHEEKPIKDEDLLDQIDKVRKKLARDAGFKTEIVFLKRKLNRRADKLSKKGKQGMSKSRKIIREKAPKLSRKQFNGDEIDYNVLKPGEQIEISIYLKDSVQDEYEIKAEIISGNLVGKMIRIYVSSNDERELHRHHSYIVEIKFIYKNHVRIKPGFEEIIEDPIKRD